MVERKLLLKIEFLRQELNLLGEKHGLHASEVIKKSTELDELLNQYQRLKLLQQRPSREQNYLP